MVDHWLVAVGRSDVGARRRAGGGDVDAGAHDQGTGRDHRERESRTQSAAGAHARSGSGWRTALASLGRSPASLARARSARRPALRRAAARTSMRTPPHRPPSLYPAARVRTVRRGMPSGATAATDTAELAGS